MKSFWQKPLPSTSEAVATYKGTDASGRHLWEIYGQTFTESVSTVGGSPVIGKPYPALANHPDSRGHWVVLVKTEGKLVPKVALPDIAGWTHRMRGPGRTSRTAWTAVDIRAKGIVANLYGGASTRGLVRVLGSHVYADLYGGYLVKMVYGSTENIVADWGGAQPLDVVLHETSGSVFLLFGNSVTRLSLLDLSEVWSRNFAGVTTASYSLFVAGDAVGCLATAANATAGGRTLRMATWDIDTGAPVLAPTELYQQPIPPFPGDPLDVPYVSGNRYGGIQAWDKICQWLPGGSGSYPDYAEGEGSQVGRKFHPFGWVDDASLTTWNAPPVYPADPQALVVKDTFRWGFSGASGDFSLPIPSGINPVICVGDTIVPHVRFTPSLVGYTISGATAFEVTGWGFPPPAERSHLRKFFTPVMAVGNQLLVVARHLVFFDTAAKVGQYLYELDTVRDMDYPPIYPDMYRTLTETLHSVTEIRGRVLLKVEDVFEVYDGSGNLVSSTPCTFAKITSMAHFPEGQPRAAVGGPHIINVEPDYQSEYTEWTPPDPGADLAENYYRPPMLGTHGHSFRLEDADDVGLPDPGGGSGMNPSDDAIVNTGTEVRYYYAHLIGGDVGLATSVSCVTKETQIDAPLLYDWTKPVLNSDKGQVIFPPKVWGDGGFDANHDMVLRDVRRSWDAPFEDAFLEDVVLGPDWRKRERQWVYAFNWPAMTLAWRHEISFALGSTVAVGIPGCGGGKCYIPYRLNSQTRLRVVNDKTGELLEDFLPSGAQVGQVDSGSQVILSGGVSLLVTGQGIMGIYPT